MIWFKKHATIKTHHAAPTTDNEMDNPTPTVAHMYGDVLPRNLQI